MNERQPIFFPSEDEIRLTQLTDFIHYCERLTNRDFSRYKDFESFSIEHYRDFWAYFLEWLDLPHEGDPSLVCTNDRCEEAEFFPNVRLNYAECLLQIRDPSDAAKPALWSCRPDRSTEFLTRGELRRRVASLAASLEDLGVGSGSRIAIIAHNDHQAVIAMLAAAALGAVVSMTSPDLEAPATIARLRETQPELLFCHLCSPFLAIEEHLRERIEGVVKALPSIKQVVALDDAPTPPGIGVAYETVGRLIAASPDVTKPWRRFPFNQPLFILFTSGTTGRPKCLVQGAGGILLQHLKEMRLHIDVRPTDKVFFQASTAWVIWTMLLSNLAVGAEVVLNSRPVSSPKTLWQIVGEERVSVFCTSPAYLQLCEAHAFSPRDHVDLQVLRTVLTAGAILYKEQQDWFTENVKALPVRSMYGATDVGGSIVTCNPNVEVYAGECSSVGLGFDVRALHQGEMGLPAPIGEVVIANPFPSRPLGLLDDKDGARFHEAYFAQNPGFWTQGDFIEFYPEGGARLHGRCDGILNIRGVRMGPVEIYDAVITVPEIARSLVVAQARPDAPGQERLVLLVVLKDGIKLDDPLVHRIKREIGHRASAIHVPDRIAQVSDLPMTHNGKLSERAAADAVNGRDVVNRDALQNPECLESIAFHPVLRPTADARADAGPAPSDEATETIVTRIWERIFERSSLRGGDDFFDLGGDSLKAIAILQGLDKALGTNLPMTVLYRAPTISRLAEAIDQRRYGSDHRLLVTLKNGASAPTLFIVPGLDGVLMKFRSLALAINYPGAIIGVQAQGVDDGAPPLSRVEDMASAYVNAVQTMQPHGPYLFCGHSLGGLIALEMVRLLEAAGEDVFPLTLLDPPIDEKHWPIRIWISTLIRRVRIHIAALRNVSGRERWNLAVGRVFGFCQHFVHRYDTDTQRRFAGFETDNLAGLEHIYNSSIIAAANYQYPYFDQKITIFDPEDGYYHNCDTKKLWSYFARDVTVKSVPGDHTSMLFPPHSSALAATLSQHLAELTHPSASEDEQSFFEPALTG